jgi:hypothetical protein
MVALALLAGPAGVSAQRGGGGRSTELRPRGVYDSSAFGIKFPVPLGLELYTEGEPGRYTNILSNGRIIYLIDTDARDTTIVAKSSPNVSEADLKGLKDTLESNPPQAKLPGYKKIAVRDIAIGVNGDKVAVEYVFSDKSNNMASTVRQVMFVHKGRGFTFTCTTAERLYTSFAQKFFDPIFAKMEFR